MKKYYLLSAMLATFSWTMAQELTTYSVYDTNQSGTLTASDATGVIEQVKDSVASNETQQYVTAEDLKSLLQVINSKLEKLESLTKLTVSIAREQGVDIPEELQGPFNGHAYVDLGITDASGKTLYWATCNVGATNPEDYGQYFAWGETTGYGEAPSAYEASWTGSKNSSYTGLTTKYNYSWTYYKWGTSDSIYKYNVKSSYGTVDNKTVLEASDDAATANWGGSWRMPTDAELTKLTTECYWQWVTSYNGKSVNGYVVYKAKATADKGTYSFDNPTLSATYSVTSDTHIFLPAAGNRGGSTLNDSSNGYYWSSSLREFLPDTGYYLRFASDYVAESVGSSRYYGRSVRPVCLSSE